MSNWQSKRCEPHGDLGRWQRTKIFNPGTEPLHKRWMRRMQPINWAKAAELASLRRQQKETKTPPVESQPDISVRSYESDEIVTPTASPNLSDDNVKVGGSPDQSVVQDVGSNECVGHHDDNTISPEAAEIPNPFALEGQEGSTGAEEAQNEASDSEEEEEEEEEDPIQVLSGLDLKRLRYKSCVRAIARLEREVEELEAAEAYQASVQTSIVGLDQCPFSELPRWERRQLNASLTYETDILLLLHEKAILLNFYRAQALKHRPWEE